MSEATGLAVDLRANEGMPGAAHARVTIVGSVSDPFSVKVWLRPGSSLSPLLFILVMEIISRRARCQAGPHEEAPVR